MTMADFNPPDSHWAADFDGRLTASFHHLFDRCRELEERVRELEALERGRDESLAQAVADMKFYAARIN